MDITHQDTPTAQEHSSTTASTHNKQQASLGMLMYLGSSCSVGDESEEERGRREAWYDIDM